MARLGKKLLGWGGQARHVVRPSMHSCSADQFKVLQAVYHTVLFGWSPLNVSKAIAKFITNVSPDEQKELIGRFIETKQSEPSTVLIAVSIKSVLIFAIVLTHTRHWPC